MTAEQAALLARYWYHRYMAELMPIGCTEDDHPDVHRFEAERIGAKLQADGIDPGEVAKEWAPARASKRAAKKSRR